MSGEARTCTRRRALEALGAGSLTATVGTTQTSAQTTQQWSQFAYDAANTGHAPDHTGPTEPVGQRWRTNTPERIHGSPAVVDGTLYTANDAGEIYALDTETGDVEWMVERDRDIRTSPAVHDGTVYIGDGFSSSSGALYALDATDGTELWRFECDRPIESSPTIADGALYFGCEDEYLFALDPADGTELWRADANGPHTTPAVADGRVHVADVTTIYTFDAETGEELWTEKRDGQFHSSPAVVDGVVYIGHEIDNENGVVYAFDASDGTELWSFDAGENVDSSPAVADGRVFVGGSNHCFALDASDGTELWTHRADVYTSPIVADGTVYVGNFTGAVYALDPADGTEKWMAGTESVHIIIGAPIVTDETLYVATEDVFAFDTGAEENDTETGRSDGGRDFFGIGLVWWLLGGVLFVLGLFLLVVLALLAFFFVRRSDDEDDESGGVDDETGSE